MAYISCLQIAIPSSIFLQTTGLRFGWENLFGISNLSLSKAFRRVKANGEKWNDLLSPIKLKKPTKLFHLFFWQISRQFGMMESIRCVDQT